MDILNKSDQEIIKAFIDNAVDFVNNLPYKVEPLMTHSFYPGVYIRKMLLPFAGIQLVGMEHKVEHAFILSMGRILVWDGTGDPVILKAPFEGRTLAGSQRIGISLEPVMWSDIHPTKIQPKDNTEEAKNEAVKKIQRNVVKPYKEINGTKTIY